ncbi:MAG TPA: DUF2723 domain-containing protein [Candidatus Eisenbacteria bacterium]|nr:DUF2723 domain-containing protein [Candidatus Eisenbacteria bacterium]
MTDALRRSAWIVGALVLLVSFGVFLRTLTPTVPFWDSGEFIAVANILGIPHPPGTPFYVIIARLFAMLPFATIAQRVNSLSALASALAVLLTYLTTLRLIRLTQGENRTGVQEGVAQAGAVVAALMLAFSDNFWENAIEAEVYSMMSVAQILVFWLGLRWWEAHAKRPSVGPLLLAVYVMWVSVGLHLGVGMMGLPLTVLVWLVDRRAAIPLLMAFISVLGVTFGLENMVGIVLVISTCVFVYYAFQGKIPLALAAICALGAVYGMYFAFSDANFTALGALVAAASLVVPIVALARRHPEGRVMALALGLMVIGYSTHLYLPIRAALHPAINEGNPSTWAALRDLLERKQYGHTSMFVRRASWATQFGKEFWRYWNRQWPVFGNLVTPGPVPGHGEPRMWQILIPQLLGLVGIGWQWRKEKISAITTMALFLFSTFGMILFLNFSEHEVRDRDYFFTTAYHVFSIYMGIGMAWLALWVRDSFVQPSAQRWATVATAGLLVLMPFGVMKTGWFFHDRRGNYVAHDYAYNMLAPLAPNSYVFTNGDNDTFPLWYMQQVENFRRDVRVVNLSLLNTDWYILQLRDQDPRLPITLNDAQIHALGDGVARDSTGQPIAYTNQFMVGHLVEQSATGTTTWKKQPYFAVTVPEHMGLDSYFTLEGLVYRVNRDSLQGQIDEARTRHNLYDVFKYRGLFKPDGAWDRTIYKDENASTLSRNYAAAHIQLAYVYRRRRDFPHAIGEMERVGRMFPDFADALIPLGEFYMDAGDTNKAIGLFQQLSEQAPNNPEVHYYYGVTLVFARKQEDAVRQFDAAIQADPTNAQAYYAAYYALAQLGQRERALSYLQRLVSANPGEMQARQILQAEGGRPAGQTLPPPPMPGMP